MKRLFVLAVCFSSVISAMNCSLNKKNEFSEMGLPVPSGVITSDDRKKAQELGYKIAQKTRAFFGLDLLGEKNKGKEVKNPRSSESSIFTGGKKESAQKPSIKNNSQKKVPSLSWLQKLDIMKYNEQADQNSEIGSGVKLMQKTVDGMEKTVDSMKKIVDDMKKKNDVMYDRSEKANSNGQKVKKFVYVVAVGGTVLLVTVSQVTGVNVMQGTKDLVSLFSSWFGGSSS